MTDKCPHIVSCTQCRKHLCSHCVEMCSGCPLEGCELCYTKHLVKCQECPNILCPNEAHPINGERWGDKTIYLCPTCKYVKGV